MQIKVSLVISGRLKNRKFFKKAIIGGADKKFANNEGCLYNLMSGLRGLFVQVCKTNTAA